MNKTRIEWCRNDDGTAGYSVNPVKGLCPMACPYCYARRMYKRYHWEERITYHDEVFAKMPPKSSRIFVGSTIDLFHPAVVGALPRILDKVKAYPQHTFIFLTKYPQNLPLEWPANCWVGVTASDHNMLQRGTGFLRGIHARVKFASIEPLLKWQTQNDQWLKEDWEAAGMALLIIGQQTPVNASTMPRIEWVREIVETADKAGVKVFLKDNLIPMFEAHDRLSTPKWAQDGKGYYRQELPAKGENTR